MQAAIAIDGLDEEDFRRSIENMLRRGDANGAARRLRALIAPYVGPGKILPPRFLTASPSDLSIVGWEWLGQRLALHDRPGYPVTALSVSIGLPPENTPGGPTAGPHFETGYYSDSSFPFSQSSRDDLQSGYSTFGCDWSGDCEAVDRTLSLAGIDDLFHALSRLEAKLFASDEPDVHEIRAGSIAACLLAVMLYRALQDKIRRDGLPRPLCVLTGCNGVFPYFDAPIAGIEQPDTAHAPLTDEATADSVRALAGGPGQYASLLMSSIPRAKKRAVLVLEETADESAVRIAALRGMPQIDELPDEPAGHADARELVSTLASHFPEELPPLEEAEQADDQAGEADTGVVLAFPHPEQEPALPPEPLDADLEMLAPEPDCAEPEAMPPAVSPGFTLVDLGKDADPPKWGAEIVRFELDNQVFSRMLTGLDRPAKIQALHAEPPSEPAKTPPEPEAPAKFAWPPELAWQEDDDDFPAAAPHGILEAPEEPGPPPLAEMPPAKEPSGLWDRMRSLIVRRRA